MLGGMMEYKETNIEEEFIKPLKDIPQPPTRLWQYGELPPDRSRRVVSIIGSRRCTPYGENLAYRIARELALRGVIIVSGMAYGIDAAAHRGCLDAGGTTIAVLGTPINKLYPPSNEGLAHRIVENGGAIISEYPEGTETQRYHFLERNRLVAGLADAILITEASINSGTITTANQAMDQGRTVFAVPGDLDRKMSAGCNALISRASAQLFTNVDDLYLALKMHGAVRHEIDFDGLDSQEAAVVRQLKSGNFSGERIMKALKMSANEFNQTITMLEIKGLVLARGCNEWILV
jgi:DNA processing protein